MKKMKIKKRKEKGVRLRKECGRMGFFFIGQFIKFDLNNKRRIEIEGVRW